MSETFTYQQAYDECLEYFGGDELAANVIVTKYLLTNKDGLFLEKSPDDMHKRIAGELSRIESKYPNPMSSDEIYKLLKDFKYVVPQGSPMSGIGNGSRIQSLSNCFVIPAPEDSYGGILKSDQELVQIAKRRGGVGFDLSTIRPRGLTTANAARTTDGIEVFMDRFSNSCREVAQGGRRGALMLTISVHHPQIRDFVKIKKDLSRVTGANISVRVTDEFMNAVKEDKQVELRWPVTSKNPKISAMDNASEIWHQIIEGAHSSAEPGVLFWDTALDMTPSDAYADDGFGSVSTNPCGEIILSPYDSCRLMLLNLTSFVKEGFTEKASFDYEKMSDIVSKAQRLMDNMIDLEVEQVDKILSKIEQDPESSSAKRIEKDLWTNVREVALKGRRTGLGITGLGDALAMSGIQYGSKKSISMVEKIYKTLSISAYRSSCLLAKERGPFGVYDFSKEKNHKFIQRIFDADPEIKELSKKYGRRNIAITTTAPAGSVSVLTQTTSGIEPAFMLHYTRRKKLTGQDQTARIDFIDDSGDKWQEYTVYHHGFKKWMNTVIGDTISEDATIDNDGLVQMSPYAGATANEINWVSKVDLQAAAQKWVCHAISNTTNLPSDVTVDTVKNVYMRGWETGCKGVTVYRDGSRSGVLVASDNKSEEDPRESNDVSYRSAPKRPEELECDIHQAKIQGEAWTILVGLMNGKPYEIIGGLSEYVEIPRKYTVGLIRRRSRKSVNSKYDLTIGSSGDEFVIKDIVKVFDNPNHSAFTRTISLALRHGVPVQYMVEQLQKDRDADLFSFAKVTARCLKKYIADGTKAGNGVIDNCCEDPNVVYQEGCAICLTCGSSKCG
jgi:ribonucleoside-diphosphate reductase alpha chain